MTFPLDLVAATLDCSLRCADIGWTRAAGRAWIDAVAHGRLDRLVAHARERSPFYRERYRNVAASGATLAELPVVTRGELMARFDDWATDPAVTLEAASGFVRDPARIGAPFLEHYTVWTSSGTTGEPGIFVQDDEAMATYDALMLAQADAREWGAGEMARWSAASGGTAMIVAIGAPFPAIAAWRRLLRLNPSIPGRVYSITLPLPQLVEALNEDRPAFVATYPSLAALLAQERQAGRLAIEPAAFWCGGECLSTAARDAIEQAFGCRVHEEYGAAECFTIASACRRGAMHVHSDWVLLEPVDRAHRPVPAGVASHAVLLTNLANRVQPLIRYELGDSVTMAAAPCPCGSPLPALVVRGRSDDVLALRSPGGERVAIVPLALETVVEEALGAAPFQIVACGPSELKLRLGAPNGGPASAPVRRACRRVVHEYLVAQGLPNVVVADDRSAPAFDARTGKLRRVVGSTAA